MSIEEFTALLETEFDELPKGSLTPDMNYRDIEGWSSMHALIIVAFVDTHFDLVLSAADLTNAKTIRDLYHIVLQKTN
jgi:acyl carrier protein